MVVSPARTPSISSNGNAIYRYDIVVVLSGTAASALWAMHPHLCPCLPIAFGGACEHTRVVQILSTPKRRDPRGGSLTEGRPANSSAGVHARRFGRPACAQSTISRAESCPGQPAITVSALHTRRFSLLPNVLTVLQAGFLLRERKLGIVKLQRTALISTRSRRGCPVVQIVCLCVTWCACVLLASAPEAITGGRAMPPQVNMYRNERNNAWPGCVEDTRFLSMSQKFVCLTACTRAITSSPSEDSLSLSFFLCLSLSLSPPSSPCLYPCLVFVCLCIYWHTSCITFHAFARRFGTDRSDRHANRKRARERKTELLEMLPCKSIMVAHVPPTPQTQGKPTQAPRKIQKMHPN